jgi:hypothetical protein
MSAVAASHASCPAAKVAATAAVQCSFQLAGLLQSLVQRVSRTQAQQPSCMYLQADGASRLHRATAAAVQPVDPATQLS